ncbi:hypothetical protein ScPMuIL_008098 [Solemya velum]
MYSFHSPRRNQPWAQCIEYIDGPSERTQVDTTGEISTEAERVGRHSCMNRCLLYAAFRFESQCIDGYCQCFAHGYDQHSCLPKIGKLSIKMNYTETVGLPTTDINKQPTSMWGPVMLQGMYTSSLLTKQKIHYTIVDVDIESAENATVVLVNNYRVTWSLKITKNVSNIVLVRTIFQELLTL